ncbi:MAG: hypothetical protein KDC92_03925, partial [Bacteroidetes bacterium]|nr:hypothetical protein [Bacteroidota bacterium]
MKESNFRPRRRNTVANGASRTESNGRPTKSGDGNRSFSKKRNDNSFRSRPSSDIAKVLDAGRSRNNGGRNGRPNGRKKKIKGLDPELLIRKVGEVQKEPEFKPTRSFADMPLHPKLKAALQSHGFTNP